MSADGRAPRGAGGPAPEVPAPLGLAALARGGAGARERVPLPSRERLELDVQAVAEAVREANEGGAWLLLLEGDLIVDLPYGDFRVLKPGDALSVPAGVPFTLTPVEPSVVLRA